MTTNQAPIFPSLTTRTTVMIAGEDQDVRVDVTHALTASAAVFAAIGSVRMVFTDPGVPRRLAAALRRPATAGVLVVLPERFLLRPDRFVTDEHLVTVNWSTVPTTTTVPGGAYDQHRRRRISWVDVEAGSLTFRFFDRVGHRAFTAEIARVGQVARSVLLPADEKALHLEGR